MPRILRPALLALLACILSSPVGASRKGAAGHSRKGGVSLRLEIKDRRLLPGKPQFLRLTLLNAATRGELFVSDWKYRGGSTADLESEWLDAAERLGIDTIEMIGPDGKRLEPKRYPRSGIMQAVSPWAVTVTSADAETAEYAKSLRDSGLSPAQVTERLNQRQRRQEKSAREKQYPAVVLAPGKAVRTASFCTQEACPGDGFAELPYQFSRVGRYKVRALYSHAPEAGSRGDPWAVDLATPWVEFEVRE